jgi:hypothetical protein
MQFPVLAFFSARDRIGLVAPWWLSLSMLAELVEAARRDGSESVPSPSAEQARRARPGGQKIKEDLNSFCGNGKITVH